MPALLMQGQPHRLAIGRQASGIKDQIDLRSRFIALPEANLVVDEIDSCSDFADLIGVHDLVKLFECELRRIGHREAGAACIFLKPAPMAFEGEWLPCTSADSGEQPPFR